ncbi:hypothetical protein [Paraburkholderia silvatlantica]|uniref:Uncharacterized protein n=1 Tax=Paraburkholderia silvatlantica TaxID=321895 RepID=A0A2U0ZG79_9BURK|nr:hypothetical protein [Paraburkholderia silvatlantica]MBB2932897.1 hypothetical protein [Paraburkholderia silvatlantica]PVY17887.1 hypothetical protein C7411_1466 [Paraburkholderia silvatlantica]PXW23806.1 hypothetical protein C7413_1506 [Paraburkholderia silvatlantica]PYE12699.1 hypothetical protein C7410_1537 [Paraburkholderia silvatlantica]TDQ73597.1 hypothetical protein C7412_1467 [Paraburkholderia silvatlantica]
MAIHIRSQEAEAAQRFFEASRNVDRAFRALRAEARDHVAAPLAYGVAQSRLDHALDELARAEALFDSATAVQVRKLKEDQDH